MAIVGKGFGLDLRLVHFVVCPELFQLSLIPIGTSFEFNEVISVYDETVAGNDCIRNHYEIYHKTDRDYSGCVSQKSEYISYIQSRRTRPIVNQLIADLYAWLSISIPCRYIVSYTCDHVRNANVYNEVCG